MGMYSQIEDKLFCPFCGAENEFFQSKDLANMLESWTIKDIVRFAPNDDVVEIHDECKNCKKWISINLNIWRLKHSETNGGENEI